MLYDRERLLNSTFDNTFTLQGILDEEGRIIRANQTALNFAGVEEKDVIGKFIWDTYWWSHSEEEKKKYKNLVQEAKEYLRNIYPDLNREQKEFFNEFSDFIYLREF